MQTKLAGGPKGAAPTTPAAGKGGKDFAAQALLMPAPHHPGHTVMGYMPDGTPILGQAPAPGPAFYDPRTGLMYPAGVPQSSAALAAYAQQFGKGRVVH